MKAFSIITLGCKVNQYESQQIRELLERLGLDQTEACKGRCDLVVVNTCCVTARASAKSRQYIRKAQKLNPDAAIVVWGCLPTVQDGELNNLGGNVRLVVNRDTIAAELKQIVCSEATRLHSEFPDHNIIRTKTERKIKCKKQLPDQPRLPCLTSFKGQTRAFLKIQDGCDGCCSYCIIPKARPQVSSRPTETVLREAQGLAESGHKEIVLTGVFLGAFGQESVRRQRWPDRKNDSLAELLDKVAETVNPVRIRLSSLEPADITERLLDVFRKRRNIMPHLHLSLQSGSDAVLKRMCRQYGTRQFRQKIELVKSRLDRPALSTDIIVGFPGESDGDFQQTIDLAREVGFAKMHVFRFSPRLGTPAARMQGAVNKRVVKERSRVLHNLGIELGCKFRRQFIGEKATILTENGNREVCGRSERYFMVHLRAPSVTYEKNELVTVTLVKNSENGMIGKA